MSDAPASILPRKIGNRAPNRAKSGFSPDMLRTFCDRAGDTLAALLDCRVKVSLDSFGIEPMGDVVPAEDAKVSAALVDLNGVIGAATLMPDASAMFHLVDLMLGGDAEKEEAVIERAPSSLSDRFCKLTTDAMIRALHGACEIAIGPGACYYNGNIRMVREGADMAIAPAEADVMTLSLDLIFGPGLRKGKLSMIIPLTTIDVISGGGGAAGTEPAYEDGPWFEHMKTSVSMIELNTVAVLHREQMTLADLSRLDIGSVIPLEREAVSAVKVSLADGGDVIASGELGIATGRRAISLDGPPNAHFLEPMRKVVTQE